jgi:hypothetical protein
VLAYRILIKPQDNDDDISLSIRESIIPAIAHLQAHTPNISLESVLGEDLIRSRLSSLKLPPTILCSDLRESDIFFDSFKKK